MDEGQADLPQACRALLTIRVGEALGRSRCRRKEELEFCVDEGYAVLCEKCHVRFERTKKYNLALRDDSDVYLKKARNDPQDRYVQLNADNSKLSLQHRWHLLTAADRATVSTFAFDLFLYVQNEVGAAAFHRATASQIESARVQRMAYEVANQITLEPITTGTGHHLDITNARRPEEDGFTVPDDKTTRQDKPSHWISFVPRFHRHQNKPSLPSSR
ncbi:TPA: hypothetical protein N0F65_008013 [Lagenidium giganteum]|uniref:Uncharacterized protein n=1 Tax=Lagenidium giganteum TaxID=4803 RepID=A0AAV2YRD9_9STRA|nr:TPA: hypothetical protein N0F65_008013 [Lagenidium giganteum]